MTRRRVLQRCNSAAARRYYQRKGAFLEMRSHFQHLKSQETQNGSSNIIKLYGGFLKWWYPTTMGFPTKDDHLGVFGGYHHLRKHPYIYIYPQTGTFANPETHPLRAFVPFLPGRVLSFGLFFFAFFVASRASVQTWHGHIPKPNVTRVQSATQWTASVHTLHMPKPVM